MRHVKRGCKVSYGYFSGTTVLVGFLDVGTGMVVGTGAGGGSYADAKNVGW